MIDCTEGVEPLVQTVTIRGSSYSYKYHGKCTEIQECSETEQCR